MQRARARWQGVGWLATLLVAGGAAAQVEPARVELELERGESAVVDKHVTLPDSPPVLDMVLMVDMSGSYEDDLPVIRRVGPTLVQRIRDRVADSRFGLVSFVDFPQGDYGNNGDWPYRRVHDLDADIAAWSAALASLRLGHGDDVPESQLEAIYSALGGREPGTLGVSFRDAATKLLVMTTDAPMHDRANEARYPGPTMAEVIGALTAQDVKFIGLAADDIARAQLTRLADASGGTVESVRADSADLVDAVLAALDALTFSVTPAPRACPALELSFVPPRFDAVADGARVTFRETIRLSPDAVVPADGRIPCAVDFYVDNVLIGTQQIVVTTCVPNACGVCGALPDEVCNGDDDDCDGAVDEGGAGEGAFCATGLPGRCAWGIERCVVGEITCVQSAEPDGEVCDLTDDDCDGVIDEGLRSGCGTCEAPPDEACDGVDDDCDGVVDEGAPCAAEQVCHGGRCVDRCANNECPGGGFVCAESLCLTPCEARVEPCAAGLRCVEGACVDPCADVACGADERCLDGRCVALDCRAGGCADGERCVGERCLPDPCAALDCPAGEFCREGACVASCAWVSCPGLMRCLDGACVADDCAGVECPGDTRCRDGACVVDPCGGVSCGGGTVCVDGFCVGDPCAGVVCPPGEHCVAEGAVAQCSAGAPTTPPRPDMGTVVGAPDMTVAPDARVALDLGVAPPDRGLDPDATPGVEAETVGCAVGRGARGGWLALLLLALPLVRRRRPPPRRPAG